MGMYEYDVIFLQHIVYMYNDLYIVHSGNAQMYNYN